jgi:hypothetical protein
MPLFKEVVISLEFINLNQEIICTCSRNHQLPWMWLQGISFCKYKRCYLSKCYCWKDGSVKHGNIIACVIVSSFKCWWLSWLIFWLLFLLDYVIRCVGNLLRLPLCGFVIGVPRLTYGMFYIAIGGSVGWKMVLPLVHYATHVYLFKWLNNRNTLSFPPWWFTFDQGFGGIVVRWLMMGFTFAPD